MADDGGLVLLGGQGDARSLPEGDVLEADAHDVARPEAGPSENRDAEELPVGSLCADGFAEGIPVFGMHHELAMVDLLGRQRQPSPSSLSAFSRLFLSSSSWDGRSTVCQRRRSGAEAVALTYRN